MKKKVAIMTWCNKGINYGQVLQAYAIQTLMEQFGYKAVIVRYRKRFEEEIINEDLKHNFLNQFYEWFFELYKAGDEFKKEKHAFNRFVRKNIHFTPVCYDKESVEKATCKAAVLVCGSDQIWNPVSYDPMYYLDFGRGDQKRVAYAPSMSEDRDYDKRKHIYKRMAEHIKKLDFVSVREKSACDIVKKITGMEIECVLDPTLMLTQKQWQKKSAPRLVKEKYMFCYALGEILKQEPLIKRLAQRYQVDKIVFIPTRNTNDYAKTTKFMEPIRGTGPAEFLSLIQYASVVYTDSFHGVALSVKMEREFFTFHRYESDGNYNNSSRITGLLGKIGLMERYIGIEDDISSIPNIEYAQVNKNIEAEQKKSRDYLNRAIKYEEEL